MGDPTGWAQAFPHDLTVAHERTPRGMSRVGDRVHHPGARRDGGRDGAWLRHDEPLAHLGPDAVWLRLLPADEAPCSRVRLHRLSLRHGPTTTEAAAW